MNHIFYIMGKSSSGKDTIYKKLLESEELLPLVLYTTRPMRENEQEGREYHFTDRQGFEKKLAEGKVIEERTYNTVYGKWTYFTCSDSIDLSRGNYLGIGTLESYVKLRAFFGSSCVVPVYIEVDDGIRLIRAVEREMREEKPKYTELCRRFIADSEDFSEEKLKEAGIERRFSNSSVFEECFSEADEYIRTILKNNHSEVKK